MNRLVSIILLMGVFGCSQRIEVEGLWELYKVDIDMIPRGFNPTYLKFEKGGSFSVSQEEGDLIGLYKVNKSLLSLSSTDKNWFNKNWKVFATEDELVLNDPKNDYRRAQLRFRRISRFPDFEEFQEALNGDWELYKIDEKENEKDVNNTFFTIDDDEYAISKNDTVLERGKVLVDTRHQKITFENGQILWDVRFVWDQLRLENSKMGITYRLRKSDKP